MSEPDIVWEYVVTRPTDEDAWKFAVHEGETWRRLGEVVGPTGWRYRVRYIRRGVWYVERGYPAPPPEYR